MFNSYNYIGESTLTYYVNINAGEGGNGTKESPFKKIQQAADIALPGDEVIVAPGVYREYVNISFFRCKPEIRKAGTKRFEK